MVGENRERRAYTSPLRDHRAAETRRKILDATARVIADDGVSGFSVREIASRAGVAERTVYHHYPDRQALLDGLAEWVDELIADRGVRVHIGSVDDLPGLVRDVYSAFDDIGAPAVAMARLSMAEGMRSTRHHRRTEGLRRLVGTSGDLAPDEVERRFAVVRVITASTTWLTFREAIGLSGDDAARAAGWAMETLLSPSSE